MAGRSVPCGIRGVVSETVLGGHCVPGIPVGWRWAWLLQTSSRMACIVLPTRPLPLDHRDVVLEGSIGDGIAAVEVRSGKPTGLVSERCRVSRCCVHPA